MAARREAEKTRSIRGLARGAPLLYEPSVGSRSPGAAQLFRALYARLSAKSRAYCCIVCTERECRGAGAAGGCCAPGFEGDRLEIK